MRTVAAAFCLAILIGTAGCSSMSRDDQSDAPAKPAAGISASGRQVTGTVRHVDLEGGFYGIETDEGARLDPVNLPEVFHKDGLRIRAWVEDLKDRVSFRMWGTLVRIRDIERL